jgi:hypothetical protein
MEIELEQLKGSVMALVMAANSSAEGETYRELSDAVLRVRPAAAPLRWPWTASFCTSSVCHQQLLQLLAATEDAASTPRACCGVYTAPCAQPCSRQWAGVQVSVSTTPLPAHLVICR